MSEREFETMLRFKAGAGIVPLCQWVRELRAEYEREIASAARYLNCDRFDGYLEAIKAFKEERHGVEVTIENVLYWLFQSINNEVM